MKHFKEEIIRDIFNDAVVVTTKKTIIMHQIVKKNSIR